MSDLMDAGEFDRSDRILLGACAAVWLAALGAGVAATVALVDLGTGHAQSTGESDTPWLLYAVIAISAAVIIGAVPLLLRARRAALEESPPRATPVRATEAGQPPPVRGAEAPTEKLRVPPTAATRRVATGPGYATREAINPPPSPVMTAVDQLWLRCAVVIAIAMGAAMVAIGVAAYLMAVDNNTAAWVFYVLAGLVTVAMPAIPWLYLRQLHALLEPSRG
jgi:Protein of unknown function (DUF2561)